MRSEDDLSFIVRQVHTTILAAVDDEGLPVTAAVNMMESDSKIRLYPHWSGKMEAGRNSVSFSAFAAPLAIETAGGYPIKTSIVEKTFPRNRK